MSIMSRRLRKAGHWTGGASRWRLPAVRGPGQYSDLQIVGAGSSGTRGCGARLVGLTATPSPRAFRGDGGRKAVFANDN